MGLLAAVRPTAGVETNIYTVPTGKKSVVNLTIVNTNTGASATSGLINLGIQSSVGALALKDYILYSYNLQPNGEIFQLTGLVLSSGCNIRALSTSGTYNIHVNGIEEQN